MAKKRFFMGTLAVALAFGLALAGCPTEGEENGGNNSGPPGLPTAGKLTITGLEAYIGKHVLAVFLDGQVSYYAGEMLHNNPYNVTSVRLSDASCLY
ncbi:MAG: hypothetical protein LBF78_02670 [Treponema sp.]|jgi:hypothetical protein|nr:hypothetical protein [Treponema sp.]